MPTLSTPLTTTVRGLADCYRLLLIRRIRDQNLSCSSFEPRRNSAALPVFLPPSGLHPLHLAVRRDGERCLRLLVEGGAKINAPEQKSGNTALHLAVRENLFKVACTLITEVRHTWLPRTLLFLDLVSRDDFIHNDQYVCFSNKTTHFVIICLE